MAAPITHIVFTEKVFDKLFKDKTRKDFFVGTLFPDIRYLNVISRDKTHYDNLSIAKLINDESFAAGVKFHSIVDQAREKFVVENNTYLLCPKSKYITQSLKILEDEIFYNYVEDWEVIINYLNKILPIEKDSGIAKKYLEKWHLLLQQYFHHEPDRNAVSKFTHSIGFSQDVSDEINRNVAKMRTNEKIIKNIKELYNNLNFE